MYIASLVLGIVAMLLCWVPVFGFVVATVGLIISIFALAKKDNARKSRGFEITGLILSIIAIIIALLITLSAVFFVKTVTNEDVITKVSEAVLESDKEMANNTLKVEYATISLLNKDNEYTGYIDKATKEYTDSFSGIEIEKYYEDLISKILSVDYSVEVNSLGTPTLEIDD